MKHPQKTLNLKNNVCRAAAVCFALAAVGVANAQSKVDNEAGFLIPNANGTFPGGDLQFIASGQSGFLGMFGGTGYWNSGLTYTEGTAVTLTMQYFYDAANSSPAFQFTVVDGTHTATSPVQDYTGGSIAGDSVGAYYQIQNDPSFPANAGQAVFGNINMTLGGINSAVITPRVFNDIPGATGTYLNSYPGSITLGEAGVSAPTGFADRDIWQFANGGTAYTFGAADYFTASMTLDITGNDVVPEPSTMALLGLGLLPLARRFSRRA